MTNVTDMSFDYTDAEIPLDIAPDPAPESSDLRCLECGVPLAYGGRGRKPKYCDEHKKSSTSASGAKRAVRVTADVNAALSTMESAYNLVEIGLYMASRTPNADGLRPDQVWESKQQKLLDTDKLLFTSDPTLTAKINKFGQKSATGSFVVVHVMALAPILGQVYVDVSTRRAAVLAEQRARRAAAQNRRNGSTASMPMPDDPTARYMP